MTDDAELDDLLGLADGGEESGTFSLAIALLLVVAVLTVDDALAWIARHGRRLGARWCAWRQRRGLERADEQHRCEWVARKRRELKRVERAGLP
ncbi:MAG: hypothetical protein ACJ8AO_02980 [Gemmatimonadaceae bacterium]